MSTAPLTACSVLSRDGTRIAYLEAGSGPGLVLVHGAMQCAANFTQLAQALASSFRVAVLHRRGRGGSGPAGPAYGLDREIEDLDAVCRTIGARFVFGLSSGALISLFGAGHLEGIEKVALYEPPLTIAGFDPASIAPRCLQELERGQLARAMVTITQGVGDQEWTTSIPRFVIVPLTALALRLDAASAAADRVAIRDLIPTVRNDLQLQREASVRVESLSPPSCELLLMGGDRSHPALQGALDVLASRLPRANRLQLHGIGHLAADDTGRPREVADALRRFFAASPAVP